MSRAIPARQWLVRAMRVGPTRDRRPDRRRFFTSACVQMVAGLLPGTPVCDFEDNGRRVHPPLARVAEFTVGRVDRAWLQGSSLFAWISIEDDRVCRELLARERDGRLYDLGVSLQLKEPQLGPAMGDYWRLDGAAGVYSLDFVDDPAGDRACVLRSLAPKLEEMPT